MEVRIGEWRHAEVVEWWDRASGRFLPVSELADDARVVVIVYEDPSAPKKKRFQITADVHSTGVYDPCGYMIAQEWCDWSVLEALRDRLGLGNFNRRVYIYNGGMPEKIMPALMTVAGQHYQIQQNGSGEKLAEALDKRVGFSAMAVGDKAVSVWEEKT